MPPACLLSTCGTQPTVPSAPVFSTSPSQRNPWSPTQPAPLLRTSFIARRQRLLGGATQVSSVPRSSSSTSNSGWGSFTTMRWSGEMPQPPPRPKGVLLLPRLRPLAGVSRPLRFRAPLQMSSARTPPPPVIRTYEAPAGFRLLHLVHAPTEVLGSLLAALALTARNTVGSGPVRSRPRVPGNTLTLFPVIGEKG